MLKLTFHLKNYDMSVKLGSVKCVNPLAIMTTGQHGILWVSKLLNIITFTCGLSAHANCSQHTLFFIVSRVLTLWYIWHNTDFLPKNALKISRALHDEDTIKLVGAALEPKSDVFLNHIALSVTLSKRTVKTSNAKHYSNKIIPTAFSFSLGHLILLLSYDCLFSQWETVNLKCEAYNVEINDESELLCNNKNHTTCCSLQVATLSFLKNSLCGLPHWETLKISWSLLLSIYLLGTNVCFVTPVCHGWVSLPGTKWAPHDMHVS